ncbi:dTDP-4-dehydrorhamnose reductase [Bacteroidales bacterium OttesenSCG-928-I14]|nr:dTDP-4-dehydrorhamnose reductase [Bacteroidales bacterium OttesenSCG-928-I14]
MTNVLITGANGQLGSDLQKISNLYPRFRFIPTDIETLDLTNQEQINSFIVENKIDYIVNCAAYTAVDRAEDDKETCFLVNTTAVSNLAKAAYGKARIIHISTDYVFSGSGNQPLKETDETNPQSVYGESKLEGEIALQKICPDSIIIRTSWLYSTFGNNFVKTMIRLGKEKEVISVVNDQYGTPTYAADLAKVIMDILEYSETSSFMPGIYHYSNEGCTTWQEFASKIMSLNKLNCKVEPIPTSEYPTKAKRPMYSVMDKTKIKNTFGLTIPQWEESLEKCTLLFS